MGNNKHNIVHVLILLLHLETLLITSLAYPHCPYQPKHPPKPPVVVRPPPPVPPIIPKHPSHNPKTPIVKSPPYIPKPPHTDLKHPLHSPKPPTLKPPPYAPKPPPTVPKPPTHVPKPPTPEPPTIPKPPLVLSPLIKPLVIPIPSCPIDTLKLDACVDVLGGLIRIGIGASTKNACCPVLKGLVDLDAALCLCTTIKAKLLNINIFKPIALQVLVDCGKVPPSGFQCPEQLPH
ncbi:hypothetical protein OROGR_000077 [Orobanche gracilis]